MNTKTKHFSLSGLAYALVLILLATTMVGIVAYAAGSKTHNIGGNVTFSADGVEATVAATNWEGCTIGGATYSTGQSVLSPIIYSKTKSDDNSSTTTTAWENMQIVITNTSGITTTGGDTLSAGQATLSFSVTNNSETAGDYVYVAITLPDTSASAIQISANQTSATLDSKESAAFVITFAVASPDYNVSNFSFSIGVEISNAEITTTALEVYENASAIKGYSVNMGEYPQTIASELTTSTNGVVATDTYFDEDETLPIYTYNGDRYVYASASYYSSNYGTDGTYFFKIEPIVWDIIAFYDSNDLDGDGNTTETISDLSTYGASLTNEQVIVLSHSGLEAMAFEDSGTWSWGSGTDIYDWLNGTFYNSAFTTEEQGYIVSHDDSETAGTTDNESWTVYSSISGVDSNVWLLSITEVDSWFTWDDGTYYSDLICYNTDYSLATGAYGYSDGTGSACYWWLRSCGRDDSCAYNVYPYGYIYVGDGVDDTYLVARPALLINL